MNDDILANLRTSWTILVVGFGLIIALSGPNSLLSSRRVMAVIMLFSTFGKNSIISAAFETVGEGGREEQTKAA